MKTSYKSTSRVTEGSMVDFDKPILCHDCQKKLNRSNDVVYVTVKIIGNKYSNKPLCKKCLIKHNDKIKGYK